MLIISHRGNLNGKDPERENHPGHIESVIRMGFLVEVDLTIKDGQPCLGHDHCGFIVPETWLYQNFNSFLLHAKSLESLAWLAETFSEGNYFAHNQDGFAITSQHKIWQHDLTLPVTRKSIIPLLSLEALKTHQNWNVHAVCTDYPMELKRMLAEAHRF